MLQGDPAPDSFWEAAYNACTPADVDAAVETLRSYLAGGVDINAVGGKRNSTVLHDSCVRHHVPIIRQLIEAGADVNTVYHDPRPFIPIEVVGFAPGDSYKQVTRSIDHAYWGRQDGDTALHIVARSTPPFARLSTDGADCLRALLEAGADPHAVTPDGLTPCETAVGELDKEEMESLRLLEQGAPLAPPSQHARDEVDRMNREHVVRGVLASVLDEVEWECGLMEWELDELEGCEGADEDCYTSSGWDDDDDEAAWFWRDGVAEDVAECAVADALWEHEHPAGELSSDEASAVQAAFGRWDFPLCLGQSGATTFDVPKFRVHDPTTTRIASKIEKARLLRVAWSSPPRGSQPPEDEAVMSATKKRKVGSSTLAHKEADPYTAPGKAAKGAASKP